MTATSIRILSCRDGFSIKDPRGFNVAGGAIGRGVGFPLPPTTAGASRTAIGDSSGWIGAPQIANWEALPKDVAVEGPLAVARNRSSGSNSWEPLFPAPRDLLVLPPSDDDIALDTLRLLWLEPRPPSSAVRSTWSGSRDDAATEALDWPRVAEKVKPLTPPAWWGRDAALEWLLTPTEFVKKTKMPKAGWVAEGRFDMRLAIDRVTRTARTGYLYGLETEETLRQDGAGFRELGIWLRVARGPHPEPAAHWRFGGEARWASALVLESDPFVFPRDAFAKVLDRQVTRRCRLLLMTPGVFRARGEDRDKHRPGWLPDLFEVAKDELVFRGQLAGIDLTLRAALVGRAGALSGWDFKLGGPKASRLYVPPGAIFYVEAGRDLTVDDFAALWLATLQVPRSQEARDGFGLVVPGLWPINP